MVDPARWRVTRSSSRVIVLGLDGLDWGVVDALVEKGLLPALQRVMDGGVSRVMRSTTPPLTPAAWSTLFSGLPPAEHGIFDFTARESGRYRFRLCAASDRQADMLWSLASDAGRGVVVVNVPMTFPATAVNGLMVSGMDAPTLAGAVHPASATATVLAISPDYRIDAMSHWFDDRDEFADRLLAMHRARHRLAVELLHSRRPELFICVYVLADRVQHVAWSEPPSSEVVAAYQTLDGAVADYLDSLGEDDSLVIVSDHGFQELRSEICLNQLLEQAGLLVLDRQRCRQLLDRHRRRLTLSRGRRAGDHASPWGLPPRALWFDAVDWSRTRCAAFGLMGNMMLNLRGRDPQGLVLPGADAAAVLRTAEQAVADRLRGERVIAHPVDWDHRRSRRVDPPDAVLEIDGYHISTWGGREFYAPDSAEYEPRESAAGHTGVHSPDAVLIAMGRGFEPRVERGTADALDIVPTLADLLALDLPDRFSGRSLVDGAPK